MSEESGSNAERIRMTLRLDREIYMRLRDFCQERDSVHNRIVERAVERYLDEQERGKKGE